MKNYKLITRLKLRFPTAKGYLSVEQLWDLSLEELDKVVVSLEDNYNKSSEKSYIVKASEKDAETKLMFDVALDILQTKMEEKNEQKRSYEIKKHNEKILELIDKKKDEELSNLSIDDLTKLIK